MGHREAPDSTGCARGGAPPARCAFVGCTRAKPPAAAWFPAPPGVAEEARGATRTAAHGSLDPRRRQRSRWSERGSIGPLRVGALRDGLWRIWRLTFRVPVSPAVAARGDAGIAVEVVVRWAEELSW